MTDYSSSKKQWAKPYRADNYSNPSGQMSHMGPSLEHYRRKTSISDAENTGSLEQMDTNTKDLNPQLEGTALQYIT